MNKALQISALVLSLAVGPLPAAGPSPDPDSGVSRVSTTLPGPGWNEVPAAEHPAPAEPSPVMQATATQARFGTQKLAYQSLVHHDRDRPGAVAEWRPGAQTGVRGFVFHPEIDAQPARPTEEQDLEHQLLGVIAEHALPLRGGDTLTLQSAWVAGSELPEAADDPAVHSNTYAWSLGANASLLDARLRLAIEQAGSNADEGGTLLAASDRGEAQRLAAEWRPPSSGTVQWHAGAEWSWVGPEFDSAANADVKTDRERLGGEIGVGIHDWRFGLSARHERDNLLGDRLKPAEEIDRYRLTAAWKPPEVGAHWAVGRPQITLGAEFGRNRTVAMPHAAPEVAAHNRLTLESAFKTEAGRWGLRAARGLTPGTIDSGQRAGIDTAQLELYRDQRSFKPLPVRAQLKWQQREDRIRGTTKDRWQVRFGSRPIVVHERLGADLDLRYRLQAQSHTRVPETDVNFGGRLVWTVDRPTDARSGLALILSADYRDRQSPSRDHESDYRLLLTLSSTHPFADW